MQFKRGTKTILLSVIYIQLWLPNVNTNCGLSRGRAFRPKPPRGHRRQWKFPMPARRPKNVTTEPPFDPFKEDEENFTGTTHVDEVCSTQEKVQEATTTLLRVSFTEDCDYLAFYCLRAYETGYLCGRTLYYQYENFQSYCMLDYINCMERYEGRSPEPYHDVLMRFNSDSVQALAVIFVWQVVHMGKCFVVNALKEYEHYSYRDDYFLDQMFVVE